MITSTSGYTTTATYPTEASAADLERYDQAFDAAWTALMECVEKLDALNDVMYDGDVQRFRVPQNDMYVLIQAYRPVRQGVEAYTGISHP